MYVYAQHMYPHIYQHIYIVRMYRYTGERETMIMTMTMTE